MLITVDTVKDSPEQIRAACGLLLSLLGDLSDDPEIAVKLTSAGPVPAPGVTIIPPPPSDAGLTAIPPNFPPPPLPPAPSAETGAASTSTAAESSSAAESGAPTPIAGVPPAAPAPSEIPPPPTPPATSAATSPFERDSAGMPWDVRIHQKGKSRKKDGTWKLQKNIDQALVQSVVKELAGSVLTVGTAAAAVPSAAPAAQPVALPAANSSPGPAPASSVPVPPAPAAVSVPVPPAGAGGLPSGVTFRTLVDKIVEGTKSGKLTATRVQEICQSHGAPSLASLSTMQHLISEVNTSIDVALLDVSIP